tara:strand:+ start:758 stop:1555 length:798 start_codon:yes stop_codon:yes gene_type:complete
MKKYLVIGNPIEHSLSPKLHNYWIKKNNINAIYEKKLIKVNEIRNVITDIKNEKIDGINVTLPFKKSVIQYLDELSIEAKSSQSVNTVYKEDKKIIGHNTDIAGFELSLRHINFDVRNKKVFILGAGGVVSSIIFALNKMNASSIILSNRTKQKAEEIKKNFNKLNVVNWGDTPENSDLIINATSVGLKEGDKLDIDYEKIGSGKFFYDVIYNPKMTNFLKIAKSNGNFVENGKMMFIYQAHQAFTLWHKIMPEINNEAIELLDK